MSSEALECLGGNGYAEDSGMPRIYREAPLNSIWEGSGNVNSLDVLRAIVRAPQSLEAVAAEIDAAAGADRGWMRRSPGGAPAWAVRTSIRPAGSPNRPRCFCRARSWWSQAVAFGLAYELLNQLRGKPGALFW